MFLLYFDMNILVCRWQGSERLWHSGWSKADSYCKEIIARQSVPYHSKPDYPIIACASVGKIATLLATAFQGKGCRSCACWVQKGKNCVGLFKHTICFECSSYSLSYAFQNNVYIQYWEVHVCVPEWRPLCLSILVLVFYHLLVELLQWLIIKPNNVVKKHFQIHLISICRTLSLDCLGWVWMTLTDLQPQKYDSNRRLQRDLNRLVYN